MCVNLFVVFLYYSFYICRPNGNISFIADFLILQFVTSVFYLVNLSKDLSILLIFSQNLFYVSFNFCILFLYYNSLIPTVIVIISTFLLVWVYFVLLPGLLGGALKD